MDGIPITLDALVTFAGALFLALVAGLWLKHYLKEWRYAPLFVLGFTLILTEAAHWLGYSANFTAQRAGLAAFWALFAATLETFGYEVVVNVRGVMGIGRRSDQAIVAAAVEAVKNNGGEVLGLPIGGP